MRLRLIYHSVKLYVHGNQLNLKSYVKIYGSWSRAIATDIVTEDTWPSS